MPVTILAIEQFTDLLDGDNLIVEIGCQSRVVCMYPLLHGWSWYKFLDSQTSKGRERKLMVKNSIEPGNKIVFDQETQPSTWRYQSTITGSVRPILREAINRARRQLNFVKRFWGGLL